MKTNEITVETKRALLDFLRWDSIFQLMKAHERLNVRGYILGWDWAELPKCASLFLDWRLNGDEAMCETPEWQIDERQNVFVSNGDNLSSLSEYKKRK